MTATEDVEGTDAGTRPSWSAVFGRPGGPARLVLGVLVLVTLLGLTVTVARLDLRLGTLVALNQESLDGARRVAAADDRLTSRLHQLTGLADDAHRTLDQTRAVQPVLAQLRDAIGPAGRAAATGRAGGEHTTAQLARIRDILSRLNTGTGQLARSAEAFNRQGADLIMLLDGLVADVRTSLEATRRIDSTLPLPRTAGR